MKSPSKLPFILLAEDDDNDAFGIELAFHDVGLKKQVWRVADAGEAIAYLTGAGKYRNRAVYPEPSLLLLDLRMTGKDGFELLKWVRSDPRWKNLVAVVLTNSEADSDKQKAYALGANSYLIKPTNFKGFAEMLRVLERYWSINQIPSAPERRKISSSDRLRGPAG
jgi:CheY-like chemotaxis protein